MAYGGTWPYRNVRESKCNQSTYLAKTGKVGLFGGILQEFGTVFANQFGRSYRRHPEFVIVILGTQFLDAGIGRGSLGGQFQASGGFVDEGNGEKRCGRGG